MKARARPYRPTPPTVARAEATLKLWEERGGLYNSCRAWCKGEKIPHTWIIELRRNWPAFKARMDKIETQRINSIRPATASSVAFPPADDRYAHLEPPWKRAWLETYRSQVDHRKACDAVRLTLDQVEAELEKDKAFRKVYEAINHEHVVGLEDAMKRAGLAGRAEAQRAVLEAKAPEVYGKKLKVDQTVNHRHSVTLTALQASPAARPRWHEIHGRHQAALQAGEAQDLADVIEGELVQA